MFHKLRAAVKEHHPLVHCITNPISINQCANAILAVGGRPIMAEHPGEVQEITETADALMLNLGNITDIRMQSMQLSAQTARARRIPILLDAVGVGCSSLRRDFAWKLISDGMPEVIKGNYSEIHALYQKSYRCTGVDADSALKPDTVSQEAAALARRHHTIILASGKTDLVTDGKRLVSVKNGTPLLSGITGTGCMLGALCAAYLAAQPELDAVVCACGVLGICGQLAETSQGTGSFQAGLFDALSTLTDADMEHYLALEESNIETI